MLRGVKLFLVGCVLLALFPSTLFGAGLKAGVAKVEITPATGEPMYGYASRTARATGKLDPLYARVLVLETERQCVALVTLDLGRVFGAASLRQLRDAARQSGIHFLLVTASHTHAGPNILDEYPGNKPPAWEITALERIGDALREARQSAAPARVGTGYGEANIGYNRRRVNTDGSVTMLWQNPTRLPTSPVDPTVAVLRVDDAQGKPLAILVNHACHPVVFGPDNLQYSADFVGVMCKTVEESFANQPLCFFLQGADGDINPYHATMPRAQGAEERRDWTGRELAAEAVRVAEAIRTEETATPSLDFTEDVLTFRWRWDPERFRQGLLRVYGPPVFDDHAGMLRSGAPRTELGLAVTTLLINQRIAFLGMPGEPFVDFQISWRDRCPARDAFFLGYANGYFDYFPTIRASAEGGYGAADSNAYLEIGAGERMVDHALTCIYELLGRLSDMPEDLKKK